MPDFYNDFFTLMMFTWPDVIFRLVLACLFGLFIGLDRDRKNKPVDFCVYIIVAVTTTIVTIMAQEINSHFNTDDFLRLDLGKIIAGVLTGIGFLGAGAIIKKNDDQVVGTATGASIWAAGGMGLCLGFGLYGLAFALFATLAFMLYVAGFIANLIAKK